MKLDIVSFKEPFEHYVWNNIFSETELKQIWIELDFLSNGNFFHRPDQNIRNSVALDPAGNSLANRHCVHLNDSILDFRFNSKIYELFRSKFYSSEFYNNGVGPLMKYVSKSNQDSIIVSYYKDQDYYKPHTDISAATICFYLWKDKKDFEGGDLLFTEYDYTYTPNFNSAIMFPSCMEHEAKKIVSLNTTEHIHKRICITMLVSLDMFVNNAYI